MNKTKTLIKNTIIFAIGNFSTKLLQFLLIPFYTRVLTDYEYGVIDLLHTIATLIIPIISLTIYEAVFRYSMDKNYDKTQIFSIGLFVSLIGIIFFSLLSLIIYGIFPYEYIIVLIFYVSTNIIRTIFAQFTRAVGKLKIYTTENILNVFITIIFNIIFIVSFDMNINGYLLGYVVGNIFSIIFLFIVAKLRKYINLKDVDKYILKKMLKFSVPLIPNTICWWIVSFSDRLMITMAFGAATNGLYSVANKIPTIITIFSNIFFDAWQISANSEYGTDGLSKFYTDVFKKLFLFLAIITCLMLPFSEIGIKVISGKKFWDSWLYMPPLVVSSFIFSLSQFLGTIYTTSKKTSMAFVTNFISAITNIIFNLILLKLIGPIGAAFSTLISYFLLFILRIINTRNIIKMDYDFKNIIFTILLIIVEMFIIIFKVKLWFIISLILTFIILFQNYREIIDITIFLKNKLNKKIRKIV